MTYIEQEWSDEDGENVLLPWLKSNLPKKFSVNNGEMITDALVILRISDIESGGERYEYTTSRGLPFALGRGMIQCIHEQMISLYSDVINNDETNDGDNMGGSD